MTTLADHRVCNARYGQVTCYCSALTWMTLDEYGTHLEQLTAAAPLLATRDALLDALQGVPVVTEPNGHVASLTAVEANRVVDALAGVRRGPASFVNDEALVERVMAERFRYVCMHSDDNEVSRIAETHLWLRALAAALTEDPS